MAAGKLKVEEDVIDGLENAPDELGYDRDMERAHATGLGSAAHALLFGASGWRGRERWLR